VTYRSGTHASGPCRYTQSIAAKTVNTMAQTSTQFHWMRRMAASVAEARD
jgi:hypothetical protein